MARRWDPRSVSGFGAFSEGLLGGIERSQEMRRRYEQDQLLKEQRADRERARQVQQALPVDVEGLNRQSEQFVGPYANPEEAVQFNPSARLESYRAQINMIEDPERRKAASERLDQLTTRAVIGQALQAQQAFSQGDQAGAAAALNRGYEYLGGVGGAGFKIDANGNLVDPAGDTVDDRYFAGMAQMASDPTKAMEYMRAERLRNEGIATQREQFAAKQSTENRKIEARERIAQLDRQLRVAMQENDIQAVAGLRDAQRQLAMAQAWDELYGPQGAFGLRASAATKAKSPDDYWDQEMDRFSEHARTLLETTKVGEEAEMGEFGFLNPQEQNALRTVYSELIQQGRTPPLAFAEAMQAYFNRGSGSGVVP